MGEYLKILIWVLVGIILLCFGYFLFFGEISPHYPYFIRKKKKSISKKIVQGKPGDPKTCLVCSMKMETGGQVKTTAFPAASGEKNRLMYIRGCNTCLNGNAPRKCPICKTKLGLDDFLISRMFERGKRKNHVHVLGCNKCKKLKGSKE